MSTTTSTTRQKRANIVLHMLKKLYPETGKFLHSSTDFEFLVAVILSAQTTDKKVNDVTPALFKRYKTVKDYAEADLAEFESYIKQIGLYKSKAKNILATAKIIEEKYQGKLPQTFVEMIDLAGVGRKTANVVLGHLYGIAEGVAVDTHVKRLAKKFGLTTHTDVNKIERDLMETIPKEEWIYFTNRMIAYGREYSPARKVHDESDPISIALKNL